jgi:prepilin-type N-terminal cleavage/methylation domain-containing protein
MTGKKSISTRRGFTLIELIAAMVLVGVAAAITGVSFLSLENLGKGINARNAQLAQQRLELILAEKRKTGFPESGAGPDPCEIYSLDIKACNENLLTVEFKDNDNNQFCSGQDFENCEVTITVDSIEYIMFLYNYAKNEDE